MVFHSGDVYTGNFEHGKKSGEHHLVMELRIGIRILALLHHRGGSSGDSSRRGVRRAIL